MGLNPFETVRGVEFLDRVPRYLKDIADELRAKNELQREANDLMLRQVRVLEKIGNNDCGVITVRKI